MSLSVDRLSEHSVPDTSTPSPHLYNVFEETVSRVRIQGGHPCSASTTGPLRRFPEHRALQGSRPAMGIRQYSPRRYPFRLVAGSSGCEERRRGDNVCCQRHRIVYSPLGMLESRGYLRAHECAEPPKCRQDQLLCSRLPPSAF